MQGSCQDVKRAGRKNKNLKNKVFLEKITVCFLEEIQKRQEKRIQRKRGGKKMPQEDVLPGNFFPFLFPLKPPAYAGAWDDFFLDGQV